MTKRLLSFVAVVAILSSLAFGQTSGKIVGTVYDASQEAPLGFTNVVVQGTSLGAVSDESGRYVILDVPPGTYTLVCTYIGYSPMEIQGLAVTTGLTTIQDIQMQTEDVVGQVVTVVAEKPLINMNATNTTRVVDAELIENMAIRGVQNVVGLQTGVVTRDGDIHIRGSRYQDVAYYVDGVYMNDVYDLRNTSNVSNVAMEEMQLQTGGFSAQFGNANGGVVSTSTRTGGEKMNLDFEFVTGLGASGDGPDDKLYSLGYNLYNVSLGGAIGPKVRYFVNYEGRTTDDPRPSNGAHYSMDRTPIDLVWDSLTVSTVDGEQVVNGSMYVGGDLIGTVSELAAPTLGSVIEDSLAAFYGDTYEVIDAARTLATDTTGVWWINGYDNFQTLYGPRDNVGSDRSNLSGNVMFDLKPFKIKVGGSMNTLTSKNYLNLVGSIYGYAGQLLNSANNFRTEANQSTFYTNLTWVLGTRSYVKAKFSMFKNEEVRGDDTHWDNILDYGDPKLNPYMSGLGVNPTSIEALANWAAFGTVYDDYRKQTTSYTGLSLDYLNQIGKHELTAGFEYRGNTLKYYRVAQPIEIAQGLFDEYGNELNVSDSAQFTIYRNAFTENYGYDLFGNEDENGNSYQEPGKPTVFGGYINDKIELSDMVVNLGIRYDYFNANTQAPEDWDHLSMDTEGRIDRSAEGSNYVDTEADVQINPRLGISFPVSDKTKFHAQYGKFSQHPMLSRLYLSDVLFAGQFASGNFTQSPNATLSTEKTTQYEIGFSQVIGEVVALDVTGFYKEIRDYTTLKNRFDSELDGAEFVWAQFQNGDYGVVKGMSLGLNMKRTGGLMANLSYTVSWAEGTGSGDLSNYNIAWQSDQGEAGYPSLINPLDYDQRHTGNLVIDYRAGDFGMFKNSGVNMIYNFGSGTAYTPAQLSSIIFGRGEIYPTAPINSGVTPWTTNLDMRIDTGLELGSVGLTIYLLVQNVLDSENVNQVFTGTGIADTDGWLYTDPGKTWLSGRGDGAEDYYLGQLRDPRNWNKPRSVQLGVKMNLLGGE